ncbi:hypothetical protein EDC04DRAFT_2606315 [Pisolithus marmoratus]|nr:hypothetical protein EDC04DRAFT_2606315 [Pisolithus marmoratus]
MNADDDVLDGKKKVPDTMMHTFRAGDEVIVQGENGAMWYGVIEEVRVQHLKTIYVSGKGCEDHFTDRGTEGMGGSTMVLWKVGHSRQKASEFGNPCELVLSDHKDIISPQHIISMVDLAPVDVMKFREGEAYGPLIALDDVFTRWSMMTIGKQALEGTFNACHVCKKAYNPDRDQQNHCCRCNNWFHHRCLEGLPTGNKGMQKMVTELSLESGLSLDRKGLGVVGNGNVMMPMWKEFWMALEEMKQDMGVAWKSHITPEILKLAGESHVHYQCPICSKEGREWYL